MTQTVKDRIVLFTGIIFLSFNMRPAITSAGPIIHLIQQDLRINNLATGIITTIPLLAFALFSSFVSAMTSWWGNRKMLFVALILIVMGMFIRYTENVYILYLGTLIIGIGITVINVLIPSIIKSDFPGKVGFLTSIYSTSMAAVAGLASGLSVPLAVGAGLGWRKTLLIWGILPILALIVWIPQLKRKERIEVVKQDKMQDKSIWKSAIAWHVTLFMGFQSLIFYCVIAWLPTILLNKGMSIQMAGFMLLLVQIVGLPFTFFLPILASKLMRKWISIAIIAVMNLIGFLGLILFHQTGLLVLSIAIFSLSTGGSISLAYMIISEKSSDPLKVAKLSGMSQSFGYLLAATGPVLMGFTYDQTKNWIYPILIIQVANILLLLSGIRAINPKATIK